MHYSILESNVEKRIEISLKFIELPRICENARQDPFVEDAVYETRVKNITLQPVTSIRHVRFLHLELLGSCMHEYILYRGTSVSAIARDRPSRSSDELIIGKPAFDVQDEIMWITFVNYLAVDNPVHRGCCVR
jgi:hypothetical protein